jgi:pimeloyl-ACP methyl ester carboxylesterase
VTSSGSRRAGRTIGLVAFAVVAGVALGVAVDVVRTGGPSAWLARHHLAPPYEARGARIDVGVRSLYLDCRGRGSPTIVLEAGSGADSSTWSAVLDPLAETTRTCAYDRAGRARSDPTGTRTLRDAAAELRELLSAAGEPPPFVLVGHSLGGAFMRVFASDHRDEVAGLVLVDTFDPDLQEDWVHPLLGVLRAEYETGLDGLCDQVARVDALDWTTSEEQLRAARLGGLPIEVLSAPRSEPRLDEATNRAIAAAWDGGYETLSPGLVRRTIAWGAGHDVQIDRPDLVIEAARRLVEVERDRRPD